ncbi:MAG: hypothetical protein ACFFFH_10015 [Candidatus Thorarchaeota archaeon]
MNKIILISWIVITLSFTGLLVSSIIYEIDAFYTALNIEFEIYEATIVKNSTDNSFLSLKVSAWITNPSQISSFILKSLRGPITLNSKSLEYVGGLKWFTIDILPQENTSVTWAYTILEQDVDKFIEAEKNGVWDWFFDIRIVIVSNLIESTMYDRSQSFSGVNFSTWGEVGSY